MAKLLALLVVCELLLRIGLAAHVLLRRVKRPAVTAAWVLLLLFLPVASVVAYLLLGETWFGRTRTRRHRQALALLDLPEHHGHNDPKAGVVSLDESDKQLARLAEKVSHATPTGGNHLTLTGDSAAAIAQMCTDIIAAKHSVHLLTYIYLDDQAGRRVAEALQVARQGGVACRVLCDAVGSAAFLKSRLAARLRKSGIQLHAALPVDLLRRALSRIDLRNHRKILVIDGEVAHVGSMNIASESFAPAPRYAPWVDCTVRACGPLAREVQLVFLEDWYFETGEDLRDLLQHYPPVRTGGVAAQFVASGPNFENAAMTQLVQACLHVARHRVIITTPYFVPDIETVMAMCVAARRGVEVSLVVPRRNNSKLVAVASRGSYDVLLDCGVRIFEYTKGLLHAKTLSVDDRLSLVTSANLDRRSFELNFEASMLVYDDKFTEELHRLQVSYMNDCIEVDPKAWRTRPVGRRLLEGAASLLSPLL